MGDMNWGSQYKSEVSAGISKIFFGAIVIVMAAWGVLTLLGYDVSEKGVTKKKTEPKIIKIESKVVNGKTIIDTTYIYKNN